MNGLKARAHHLSGMIECKPKEEVKKDKEAKQEEASWW